MSSIIIEIQDTTSGETTAHTLTPRGHGLRGSEATPVSLKYRSPLAISLHNLDDRYENGRHKGIIHFLPSTKTFAVISCVSTPLRSEEANGKRSSTENVGSFAIDNDGSIEKLTSLFDDIASKPSRYPYTNTPKQIESGIRALSGLTAMGLKKREFAFTQMTPESDIVTGKGVSAGLANSIESTFKVPEQTLEQFSDDLADSYETWARSKASTENDKGLFGILTISGHRCQVTKFGLHLRPLSQVIRTCTDHSKEGSTPSSTDGSVDPILVLREVREPEVVSSGRYDASP